MRALDARYAICYDPLIMNQSRNLLLNVLLGLLMHKGKVLMV